MLTKVRFGCKLLIPASTFWFLNVNLFDHAACGS